MKIWSILALGLLATFAFGDDAPAFRVKATDIQNIVLDASPGEPWLFSITLTPKKLAEFKEFTTANAGDSTTFWIGDTELYKFVSTSIMDSNPITFRMFSKDKFLSILSALPEFPEKDQPESAAKP